MNKGTGKSFERPFRGFSLFPFRTRASIDRRTEEERCSRWCLGHRTHRAYTHSPQCFRLARNSECTTASYRAGEKRGSLRFSRERERQRARARAIGYVPLHRAREHLFAHAVLSIARPMSIVCIPARVLVRFLSIHFRGGCASTGSAT